MDFIKKMDVTSSAPEAELDMKGPAEPVECLIVGSGPAGYTAAIYAARAGLKPVMVQGMEPGGQLTTTTDVENYPGYPDGIKGPEMMEDFKKQAQRFGTDVRYGLVTKVEFGADGKHRAVVDGERLIETEALIIATGATAKYLGLESEKRYMGHGVSACATCDGFFYKNMDVAIVGGGDTACEEALYLSNICKKVYMVVRRDELRASKVMQQRAINKANIEILWSHETEEVLGDGEVVTGLRLRDRKAGKPVEIKIDGFFVAIGHKPNSDLFKGYLDMDEVGYIKTQPGTSKTKIPGVFACGDVQDPVYRQAVTAAGSGCMAALDAERYLGAKHG